MAPLWLLDIFRYGCFVAGGSTRSLLNQEEVADFDVFFTHEPMTVELIESFDAVDFGSASGNVEKKITYSPAVHAIRERLKQEKYKLVFSCPEGKLFTYKQGDIKIQLILECWGTPQEVIGGFDFNATCAALDDEFFYFSREFIKDEKTKKLSINTVTYPAATIKRLIKYKDKGYDINGAIVEFMENISGQVFDREMLRLYID
jgi:hypothetical protein